MLAAGVTAYDGGQGITLDETYGKLKIILKSWGEGITGLDGIRWKEISLKPCKREDLNFDNTIEE